MKCIKLKISFFTFLIFTIFSTAQETDGLEVTSHNPFEGIENFAYFSSCESNDIEKKKICTVENLKQQLVKNFELPKDSISQNFSGKIYFKFEINTTGNPSEIKIFEREGTANIQKSLQQSIKNLPKLIPVKNEEMTAITRFTFYIYISPDKPINFRVIDLKISEIKKEEKESKTEIPETFAVIEDAPIYPGCETSSKSEQKNCFQQNILKHVRKNFRYPEEAQSLEIQGRVSTMFIIDEEGNITNIKTRGPHPLLELETRRIINKLPKMTPAKIDDKPVRIPFEIPINFRLQ